jgi:hypothetical protein
MEFAFIISSFLGFNKWVLSLEHLDVYFEDYEADNLEGWHEMRLILNE